MKKLNLVGIFDGTKTVDQVFDDFGSDIEEDANLGLALMLAYRSHDGQLDKAGKPYILHPIYISTKFTDLKLKIISLLHDIVEDCNCTINTLRNYGISDDIIEAIDAITRRDGEVYADYINRVCLNKMALMVKIEDMKHNSDVLRVKDPKTIEGLLSKYNKWLPILEECLANYE